MADWVVVTVQTIDGQDLAADEPPQLVHQLDMDKITVRRTIGSAPLMGMRASHHQAFKKVYLRPRYHPTGPRTVQCFSHPVFLRGSIVLHNVGTSVPPGLHHIRNFLSRLISIVRFCLLRRPLIVVE